MLIRITDTFAVRPETIGAVEFTRSDNKIEIHFLDGDIYPINNKGIRAFNKLVGQINSALKLIKELETL